MNKGGVWLKKGNSKGKNRIRRAKSRIIGGDTVFLYYDPALLALKPPELSPLFSDNNYSIWNKPAGLLSQGTQWGDHYSLLRIADKQSGPKQQAHLVHRLDKEARGLVLIAHNKESGSKFSQLFQERRVSKMYEARVKGIVEATEQVKIDLDIDGKSALTRYRVIGTDRARERSTLTVNIETGRKHQIRRHLQKIGHPIVGDQKYGSAGSEDGLQLVATELSFICPFSKLEKKFEIDQKDKLSGKI